MSTVLLKTRCTKGQLVIYEDKVSIELIALGIHNENSLPYSQITGCEVKTTMAEVPLLSKGAATVKIFGLGKQVLEASFIILKDARRAQELIEERIGKSTNASTDVNDLEKLAALKAKGILTEDEFNKKKKQLLGI